VALSELLRPWSAELAADFVDVPEPQALREIADPADATCFRGFDGSLPFTPDLIADRDQRVAILAGPGALSDPAGVHRLAHQLGAPVANTWGAKGIYPWNDEHHMGTCGLQRDDFMLLGLGDFDFVLAIGNDTAEAPDERLDFARLSHFRGNLMQLTVPGAPRALAPKMNELYTRIAAIAQPGYADDSFPRHPARAVMDLKQSLGPSTRVTAQPGLAGLWIARTFPTERLGSVIVPARDRPGIGAGVGLVSAAQGTETVCVVHGPADEVTIEVMTVARAHDLPLRLVVWEDDVDWDRTDDLINAAGPVVAWT